MKKRLLKRILTGGLLMVASKGVLASCAFMDSRFGPNDSVSINFGNVVVQRDTTVGTVVATINENTLGGRNNFIQCNAPGYTTQWAAGGGLTPVVYNGQTLYESGVAGLAIRVVTPGAGSTAGRYGTGNLPRQISNVPCSSSSPAAWYRLCGGTWGGLRLQLVKIASTTGSGPMTGGSVVKALVVGETSIMDYTIGTGTVRTVACSVTNSNIMVTMGTAKNTDFSGVGSSSGDADFTINLDCDASTNVNLTIQPGSAGAANAAQGILKLDNEGAADTASGVGVQILHNNAPFALGSMIRIATTASDGAYAIPMKARYYQTLSALSPGKADANATFTMTYQ